jgi:hypothetical protein
MGEIEKDVVGVVTLKQTVRKKKGDHSNDTQKIVSARGGMYPVGNHGASECRPGSEARAA